LILKGPRISIRPIAWDNRPEFDSGASPAKSKGPPEGTAPWGEPLFVPVEQNKLLLFNNLLENDTS